MAGGAAIPAARWPGQRQGELPHPKVHAGPLATGDLVVAASPFAEWICAGNRNTRIIRRLGAADVFMDLVGDDDVTQLDFAIQSPRPVPISTTSEKPIREIMCW
jgi:hypothetical protein